MNPICPSTDELRQLLVGTLPPAHEEQAARHLDQCPSCQTKLEELATGGTNLSKVVERVHESQPAAASAYWPAIRAAGRPAAYAPTIAPPSPPRVKDSTPNFLLPPSDPAYLGRLAHFDVMRVLGH